ncbi:MAG: hypothetical protein WD061_01965 [Candidatus Saccharimonadales bacterium]
MSVALLRRRGVLAAGGGGGAQFAVGSFTADTSTGTQQFAHGLGTTPKAIFFFGSGSAAVSGTWDAHVHQVVGFSDGTTSYAVSGASEDAVTTSNTEQRIAAKCITIISDGEVVIGEADLDSWDDTNITVDWTDAPVTSDEIMFWVVGGEGVEAKVMNWQSPTSTGNKVIDTVGFQPDLVLHATVYAASSIPDSSGYMATGFGAMDGAGGQWTNAVAAQASQSTSNTGRYQRTDKCISILQANGTSLPVNEEAEFVSMNSGGFTVDFTTASAGEWNYISLCIKGVNAKVLSVSESGSDTQTIDTLTFEPSALLTANTRQAGNSGLVATDALFGIGAATGDAQRATAQSDRNGQATTDAESLWKNNRHIIMPEYGSIKAEASLTSFNADGWTEDWATDPETNVRYYIALGA